MNPFVIVMTASVVFLATYSCADEDPVRANLEKAKMEYEKSMSEYRKLANEYFDKRDEEARKMGNKKLVDQIKLLRDRFVESDKLPTTAPLILRSRPLNALRLLTVTYKQSVESYTRTKQDDLATAAEAELAEISGKLEFPSIAGTWQEGPKENRIQIIVTQDGERFRASCKYQHRTAGEIKWLMTGTVTKDGVIRGTLTHTKAPREWTNQTRSGLYLASEGKISGVAEWDGGKHEFEWTLLDN